MNISSMTNLERFDCCGSENPAFHSVYKDYNSLPCCSSYDEKMSVSENTWVCFNSYPLTPPLSPNVDFPAAPLSPNIELPAIDTFTSSFLTNPSTSAVDELLNTSFAHDIPPELPDLRDTCNEVFDQESTHIGATSRKIFNQSSSKDCMWNGRGFRSNFRTRRQSRSASPGSPSCSPVSGCINPRYVFSQFNDRRKSSSPARRLKPINGPSSDSEEEVDVVTVEKSSPRILRHPATLGVLCDDGKLLGTIVKNKNGTQPQLALITTGSKQMEAKTTDQSARGRSQFKAKTQPAMSMVIKGGSGPKTLNVQLKCVPVINSNSSRVSVKRKMNGNTEQQSNNTVVHLMRLTPTSSNSAFPESPEDEDVAGGKKRVLSLEGVSMVSSSGINRLKKDTATAVKIKNEPIQFKTSAFPMQTSKGETVGLITCEKRKPARKTTKKPVITTPYETPTNSPESSNGDAPISPKKRGSGGRFSGSEEDSIRAAHNVLERQRREGLRNLYYDLRMVVPEVAELEKAPKVCILTKAREHVMSLRRTATELQTQKMIAQEKQKLLKQRLREMAAELTSVSSTSFRNSFIVKREYPINSEQSAVYVN